MYETLNKNIKCKFVFCEYYIQLLVSLFLPFNSCRSTGRRRYSATPPDLVPCSPLRSSSVSCFPAPSQLSSSMCSLVVLCLDNLEGSISELFSLYCFPHCVPNPGPLPTSNRCLHGILLSHVPQFFIGYLVFPVDVEDSS